MSKNLLLYTLVLLATLTGCVTTGLKNDAVPDLKEKGVLLLPVTDRALFTATGVSFVIMDSSGVRTTLNVKDWGFEIPPNDGKGKRFFGAFSLPPGNYKFMSWYLNRTEGGSAKEPNEPFVFTVNKGEVVYLGNFNAIRPLGTGQFRDRYVDDLKQFQFLYTWLVGLNINNYSMKSSWWTLPGGSEPK